MEHSSRRDLSIVPALLRSILLRRTIPGIILPALRGAGAHRACLASWHISMGRNILRAAGAFLAAGRDIFISTRGGTGACEPAFP